MQRCLEELGWGIDIFEQDGQAVAEIEKFTDAGVDMCVTLFPFNLNSFLDYVEGYDVDEEIEVHRQGERYRQSFTIRQSLEDFEAFEKVLLSDCEEVKNLLAVFL